MGRQKVNDFVLGVAAGLLVLMSAAVLYADLFLLRVYRAQQAEALQSAQATSVPVLKATPAPPEPTPAPQPVRTPLAGDIFNVRFPNHDTGTDAEYSYQSDELRIAVHKVEELGVTYYMADVWMRNISCFRTAFSSGTYRGKREHAEKIARDHAAILAVNGDFLNGLVIRNGVLYKEESQRMAEDEQDAARPERATCVLYADGKLQTEEYETFRSALAMENGAWQGWQFGPTLVRDGKAAGDVNAQGRSPRCMLGYYEPGHYCLIVIDGRQKGYSIGMNFTEMTELALRLGLREAYNLDGGASAMMTFKGEIISRPSGDGETRKLPDMVVIGEYLKPEQLAAPVLAASDAVSQ